MTKQGGASQVEQPVPETPSADGKPRVSLDDMRAAAAAARASAEEKPASGNGLPKPGGAGTEGGEGKPAGEAGAASVTETPPAEPAAGAEGSGGEGGPEGGELEEPETHEERTRLGRNVAQLRKDLTEQNTRLGAVVESLAKLVDKLSAGGTPAAPAGEGELAGAGDLGDDTPIVTAADVRKLLKAEGEKQKQEAAKVADARRKYGQVFVSQFGADEFRKDPMLPKVQALVMESIREGKKDWNRMYTGNPVIDHRLNYYEAKAYLLEGGKAPSDIPPAPTRGERPIAPAGVGGDSRATGAPANNAPIAVDPVGQRFLEHIAGMGKDPAELSKRAFTGPVRADMQPGAARGAKTA